MLKKEVHPMVVTIDEFRKFKDVKFRLGRCITVISGQNGVGKSTLLALIAAGSGDSQRAILGRNFQPAFNEYFRVAPEEDVKSYILRLTYAAPDGTPAFSKRLSFKNDTLSERGIRIIPRAARMEGEPGSLLECAARAKKDYGVGSSARVCIPTIYLSLSRLYPIGECANGQFALKPVAKDDPLLAQQIDVKYREWYNQVINGAITSDASLLTIKKSACLRASFHMNIEHTPPESQSIGQDNVGNIISALVDIYILSKQPGYKGALLCVDEIEVSLHPDTQIRMLTLCERLAKELNIQFVFTTHSLTVLKEMIRRAKRHEEDFQVVYIKSPHAPFAATTKEYELLKADMFADVAYHKPKVKFYFEDEVGCEVFKLLLGALGTICRDVCAGGITQSILRNPPQTEAEIATVNKRIRNLKQICDLEQRISIIPFFDGCETLIRLNEADPYFHRVIFILDGDARFAVTGGNSRPEIAQHVQSDLEIFHHYANDRKHKSNVCFLPGSFSPEAHLFLIVREIAMNAIFHAAYWRGLEENEETCEYVSDSILREYGTPPRTDFTNDDIKKLYKLDGRAWDFIRKSDVITYFYSDYKTVVHLIDFFEDISKEWKTVYGLTMANKRS